MHLSRYLKPMVLMACGPSPSVIQDPASTDSSNPASSWSDTAVLVSDLCDLQVIWQPGETGLSAPNYSEGDEVVAQLRCSREVNPDVLSIYPLQLPPKAVWSDSSDEMTFTTDGGDGGRYDLLFAVEIEGDSLFPETLEVTFWVGDNPDAPNAIKPDPLLYHEEWGLPVFHVESDGAIGSTYEAATISFDGVAYEAEIQKRGAVSIYYPKNSFGLRFDEPELDLERYGIEQRRDHMVLITTFDDNSYIRQRLIYELWEEMADYWGQDRLTPRTFFAVLYLDGAYHGVYTASDRIDDEFALHMGLSKEGNLYKAVNHDANFYLTTSGGSAKSSLAAGFEKKEGEPMTGDEAYSDLIELVETTGSSSPHDFNQVADQWIQTDEFMDWYHLVQVSVSYDSAGKNSYLYHDPSKEQPFRYAPWDFNHSWGQDWRTLRVSSTIDNDLTDTNAIFAHFLWGNSATLMDRYRQMRADGPLSDEWLLEKIDQFWQELGPAIQRDWAQWGPSYQSYSSWSGTRSSYGDWTSPEEERTYLELWITERRAFLDDWVAEYE